MAQHCPVCKTRLWTDPLLTPSRLTCPRCGAEFKPIVSWHHFRLLLVVLIFLSVLVIAFLSRENWWWLLVIVAVAAFLWYLPRLINLQHIGPELNPSEGLLDTKQLDLDLDLRLEEKFEEFEERQSFRRLVYLAVALVLLLILTVALLPVL